MPATVREHLTHVQIALCVDADGVRPADKLSRSITRCVATPAPFCNQLVVEGVDADLLRQLRDIDNIFIRIETDLVWL